ncbi:MAG: electron transfer flavoprotein subunit alpha/FixB family protein [Syntrophorhabdales bacterium]
MPIADTTYHLAGIYMSREKDVIVYLETSGEDKEEINRKLLTVGNRLTTLLGGNLSAMIVGSPVEDRRAFEEYGVSILYRTEGACLLEYSGEVFAWAAKEALKDISFRLLLFAHTDRGSELAPRVASYLETAAVTDCVDIRVKKGTLIYERLVCGGQFGQEVSFSTLPEVVTIRPEAFDKREAGDSKPVTIRSITVDVPSHIVGSTSLELVPPDYRTVDILYAKRIIGAGSGCADPHLLSLVEELSRLLEGSIGTTRPVVDEGYIPKDRMIGQTGKTVSPELYLGLGLSGSPHHVAGIQQSKTILSVNLDPRASIFTTSDAGFVCDLNTLLPKLIDRIKRFRDEGLA